MNLTDGAAGGAKTAAPNAPAHLRWDVAEMKSHDCTLATATATSTEVVLAFGQKRRRGSHLNEIGIELVQKIALSPMTAKNLAATLRRLIEEHDVGGR